jgi:hypothetical protein
MERSRPAQKSDIVWFFAISSPHFCFWRKITKATAFKDLKVAAFVALRQFGFAVGVSGG